MTVTKFLLFTKSRRSIQTKVTGVRQKSIQCCLQRNWWFRLTTQSLP